MFISSGCNDCLRKPFPEADVFTAMQKHIGVRYIYEDQAQADTLAIEDLDGSEIPPSAFRVLSTALIAYLTADVLNFDLDLIANLIKENHYYDSSIGLAIKR